MTDAKRAELLLKLLTPLAETIYRQMADQYVDERELDPPPDREYNVNITWQMQHDLTTAVLSLANIAERSKTIDAE